MHLQIGGLSLNYEQEIQLLLVNVQVSHYPLHLSEKQKRSVDKVVSKMLRLHSQFDGLILSWVQTVH